MKYFLLMVLSITLCGSELKLEPVFKKKTFERPVGLLEAGQDSWYVLEQRGKIWFCKGGKKESLVVDLSKTLGTSNEEGLLCMVKSPDFLSDKQVYIYYSNKSPRQSIVSRFILDEHKIDLSSEVKILVMPEPYGNHNGGQLAFGPDRMLYIGVGDGGSAGDPKAYGQNLNNLHGSILRIDVLGKSNYEIPKDNPFVGKKGVKAEIFAWGLRNPWRFSFDKETNELWCGDVGQNKFEEVNLIQAGLNYGWNVREGFEPYLHVQRKKKKKNTPIKRKEINSQGPYEDPLFTYPRKEGLSITGGFVYRGKSIEEMRGWYLMSDFASGAHWLLKKEGGKIVENHRIKKSSLQVSSFAEDTDGELYMMSFSHGTIYKIVGWVK